MSIFSVVSNIFSQQKRMLSKDEIANLLNVSPEVYEAFENAYKVYALGTVNHDSRAPFGMDVRKIERSKVEVSDDALKERLDFVVNRVVDEIIAQTLIMRVRGNRLASDFAYKELPDRDNQRSLLPSDVSDIPDKLRPQLLGNAMMVQTPQGGAVPALMFYYKSYVESKNQKIKQDMYCRFRQGLDILDLEPLMYEMLKYEPNSMSKWLPELVQSIQDSSSFFKVPDTTVIQVPVTLLQMSRIDYELLNPTTLAIANRFCHNVFELDDSKDYFIKTGTFSSKFDFRNAHVHGEKEVQEIGEYFIFLSNQAVQLAGPLTVPSIYGASTTNEWVVRDFIFDVEGNPCIYKGLPLHTEYRVFIDCGRREVLGVLDYWDRELLKKRFCEGKDANSPHNIHDYIIVEKHREVMDRRFELGRGIVEREVKKILPYLSLRGQWSLDVMQNGQDFYVIDMGLAYNSALKEKLPAGRLNPIVDDRVAMLSLRGEL